MREIDTVQSDTLRVSVHHKNIARYVRLLKTPLTDLERAYILRRIDEEERALLESGKSKAAHDKAA